MLKNIPKQLSPDILKILCEMGHGDELIIADGNFHAARRPARFSCGWTVWEPENCSAQC